MLKNALNSIFVIDGIASEFTPNQLLGRLIETQEQCINDESVDLPFILREINDTLLDTYINLDLEIESDFPLAYSAFYTRLKIANSLLKSLFKEGKFRMGNLQIIAHWKWNDSQIGSMAAFYESVQNLTDYVDELGLNINDFSLEESPESRELIIESTINNIPKQNYYDPFILDNAYMGSKDAVSKTINDLYPHSWIIYIPFDTSEFRLGGSALCTRLNCGDVSINISDADYFIDCFEVVREFVEDGILLSASVVGRGGLYTALKSMLDNSDKGTGMEIDLSGIMASYCEKEYSHILFAEVPGVVIQIRDDDFDYIDAQLLLQDVAYFPLGHPKSNNSQIVIQKNKQNEIQTILNSLMQKA